MIPVDDFFFFFMVYVKYVISNNNHDEDTTVCHWPITSVYLNFRIITLKYYGGFFVHYRRSYTWFCDFLADGFLA